MSLLDDLSKSTVENCVIDHEGIVKILPHRYPFLYIDRVNEVNLEEGTVVCQKNVSFNEPYFQGHFPEDPVMPGVIQVEAMAQAMCVLIALKFEEETKGKRPAFMGVDAARFRKPVRPGDVLEIKATLEKYRRGIATVNAEVFANGALVSTAKLMATMV